MDRTGETALAGRPSKGHDMLVPGPDIQPTDREFILTTLHAAFPNTTVTVHPRPASIATLFRVHDGAVLRHELLVPRRVLDDARVKRTPLARMVARAIAEMGQRGRDVVILGDESGRVVSRLRRVMVPPTWLGPRGPAGREAAMWVHLGKPP